LQTDNDQKEYYLTDAVRLLALQGQVVAAWEGDFQEVRGINTIAELADANGELRPKGSV
jgi:bifunctional N-acetylglucosamine-1-phosphate-uridyltransferase/glucosamine-1-phosphate-acetyltransferase GlmU-like protein